jgi:hypothetical protein
VFDGSGSLRDDYDIEAILFLRQLLYVGKKAQIHCGEEAVARECTEFFDVDSELPEPESFWNLDYPTHKHVAVYDGFSKSFMYIQRVREAPVPDQVPLLTVLKAMDFVSAAISSALGEYSHRDWKFRHGPGVVSTAPRFFNKYYWKSWSNRLENVFPIAECGYHNFSSWADHVELQDPDSVEPFSKLIDVPKSFTKPRLIAAEPGEHQWCQQNIWHYFDSRVGRSWISNFVRFHDQTRNQELCRRASEDGSLATVDLSAASDRITCHAVGQMFRQNSGLLLALQATRTRSMFQTQTLNKPELVRLRKFSTMGNACTFPVETLLFLTAAIASVLVTRRMPLKLQSILALSEEVAVFGDDIIVPTDSRELMLGTLSVLHAKVNTDKSFWNGKFRESCGLDAYDGVDVTPTYWRNPNRSGPESCASAIEVRNSFHKKFYLRVSAYLASTIPVALPTVPMTSGHLGLKSYAGGHNDAIKRRWNPTLQRMEALVPTLIAGAQKLPIRDDSALLQFFTEDPDPSLPWKSGVPQKPSVRMDYRWVPDELIP